MDYRNKFPFKIGTTSYIIPYEKDHVVQNVRFLKDRVDCIQLLYFSREYIEDVASLEIVGHLAEIRKACPMEYTIHLPVDMALFEKGPDGLAQQMQFIRFFMERSAPLDVQQYVLHIDGGNMPAVPGKDEIKRFHHILEAVCKSFPAEKNRLLVENLEYDLMPFYKELMCFDMRVCMDAGHIMKLGLSVTRFLETFGDRIEQVHLHGFDGNKDHIALPRTDLKIIRPVLEFLKTYTGTVVLEVYNESDLKESLEYLAERISPPRRG